MRDPAARDANAKLVVRLLMFPPLALGMDCNQEKRCQSAPNPAVEPKTTPTLNYAESSTMSILNDLDSESRPFLAPENKSCDLSCSPYVSHVVPKASACDRVWWDDLARIRSSP